METRMQARGCQRAPVGLTLFELCAVIVVIVVIVLVVLPAFSGTRSRTGARQIKCGTQVRGIHQGLVLFAQSNRDQYPVPSEHDVGNFTIDPGAAGAESKDITANVISTLIYNGYFSTELCVSPAEQNGSIVQMTNYSQAAPPTAAVPAQALWDPAFSADFTNGKVSNFSYAQTHFIGARRGMWSNTFQATEAAIGNRGPRVTNLNAKGDPIFDKNSFTLLMHGGRSTWEGNIAYNDNHVNFETKMAPDSTPYTFNGVLRTDCLFFDEADDDKDLNNYLGIITKNGAKAEDVTLIWD